jgi:hypothetical protein
MGGGPSQQQKDAATAQTENSARQSAIEEKQLADQEGYMNQIKPFATDRLNNGLPFYSNLTDYSNGVTSKAYAPVRAAALRSTASFGGALPSGYKSGVLRSIDLQKARDFDSGLVNSQMLNEQSKQDAARVLTGQAQLLTPATYGQNATQGYSSVMNAPLQTPGIGGLLGGIAGGVINRIPF